MSAVVTLKKGEGRMVKSGGMWIFDNEIESVMGTFENGDLVLRLNLSRGFSAKYNVFENRVQNIRRADSPQRLRIIGSKVFFYL